jgi:hypothetical protein
MIKTWVTAALALLVVSTVMAQEQTYLLKDYMPQVVGSKWIMKTTGRQGETTNTIEVGEPKEIAAQPAFPILTNDAQGELIRGTLESATENAYYLFGAIRRPRNQDAPQAPTESLYDPMVVFPAKMTVGQHATATTKTAMRGQPVEVTMSLDLAAVESVTVPKGTFENCLKLVYASTVGEREMKRTVWYAKGVGIVKSEQPGFGQDAAPRIAELLEVVPAPAQ